MFIYAVDRRDHLRQRVFKAKPTFALTRPLGRHLYGQMVIFSQRKMGKNALKP